MMAEIEGNSRVYNELTQTRSNLKKEIQRLRDEEALMKNQISDVKNEIKVVEDDFKSVVDRYKREERDLKMRIEDLEDEIVERTKRLNSLEGKSSMATEEAAEREQHFTNMLTKGGYEKDSFKLLRQEQNLMAREVQVNKLALDEINFQKALQEENMMKLGKQIEAANEILREKQKEIGEFEKRITHFGEIVQSSELEAERHERKKDILL